MTAMDKAKGGIIRSGRRRNDDTIEVVLVAGEFVIPARVVGGYGVAWLDQARAERERRE